LNERGSILPTAYSTTAEAGAKAATQRGLMNPKAFLSKFTLVGERPVSWTTALASLLCSNAVFTAASRAARVFGWASFLILSVTTGGKEAGSQENGKYAGASVVGQFGSNGSPSHPRLLLPPVTLESAGTGLSLAPA